MSNKNFFFFFKAYDPELFSKALPCLSAIGCALSPDYSYIELNSESVPKEASNMNISGAIFNPNLMQNPFSNLSPSQDNNYEPGPINTAS